MGGKPYLAPCFRYWSKIADSKLPQLYLALPLGVTPSEFRRDLWRQKTSPCAIVWRCLLILRLAILVQCRFVRDRQTNGQVVAQLWQTPLHTNFSQSLVNDICLASAKKADSKERRAIRD